MPTYALVISSEEGSVTQFDHTTGAFVRKVGQLNPSWTAANSDFDTVTGLPLSGALGPTDTSVPVSVTASTSLWYLYDSYTARVLAFEPDTGSLFATFGGRRGIGAGKIELDATPRSICNVANNKFFLTDNAGGFVVQYSLFGVFQAEYSISGWATALSLSFDQITGWCWDTARQHYWALAQSSTTAYLFSVNAAGNVTGEVIDLTARLTSTLGITVGGHSNSPAERVRTRGLYYHDGRLLHFSQNFAIKVDPSSLTGDQLLVSEVNDLSPGNWLSNGTEFTSVLKDQANGVAVVYVRSIATGSLLRSFGLTFSPPDGVDGHIATPRDVTATTSEDPTSRVTQSMSMRTRITAVATQSLTMRAAIRKAITVTRQMRTRILNLGPFGSQRQMTMRAALEEPTTITDGVSESWELTDSLGEFSRGLVIQARGRAGFQVGDTLTLYAGYGTARVKVFHGEIDDISNALDTDSEMFNFSLREIGARNAQTRQVTFTLLVQLPKFSTDIPAIISTDAIGTAAIAAGVSVSGGFPSYPLFGNVAVRNETVLSVASRMIEPFNQFSSRQYYPQVRNGEFGAVFIAWTSPPSGGHQILRTNIKRLTRKQTRYLGSPNLIGLDIRVKGATFSVAIIDQVGPQTRIEYFKTIAQDNVTTQDAQNTGKTTFAQEYVLTEHISLEETWGDKVLSRTAETYATRFTNTSQGNTSLISREEEVTLYLEPPSDGSFSSIQTSSAGPSPLALPYQTNSVSSGIDPTDGKFKEVSRQQTEYLYDQKFQLAAETTSVNTFDTATKRWVLDSVQVRPHSETTGGSTRIRRYSFTNTDGVLSLDTADGQQVGGGRPDPASITGLATVVTSTVMVPTPDIFFDVFGTHITEPAPNALQWTYENGFMGEDTAQEVFALAGAEKAIQVGNFRWDEFSGECMWDPNLHSGMPISLEFAAGQFVSLFLESVTHRFNTDEAISTFTAKRLTQQGLP